MPTVPVYQRTERARPILRQGVEVQASPGDFGAQIGQGMQQVAGGLSDVGDAFAFVAAKESEARIKQADNQLADWDRGRKYDPQNGYLVSQGQNAVTGLKVYEEDFEKERQRIADSLSPTERTAFLEASDARRRQSLQTATIHAGQERKSWFKDASTARQATFENDALAAYNDPKKVDQQIYLGLQELRGQGQDQGWAPETLQTQSEIWESSVRKNVALRLADDDISKAESYLSNAKGRMTAADYANTLKTLKPLIQERDDRATAQGILSKVTGTGGQNARFAAAGLPPQAYGLLGVIAGTESPGYNIINGGEKFGSYDDHPRRTGAGGTSTAAGRYQFVKGTWDRVSSALGLPNFLPENQDKGAWWLAQADYKARTGRDLTGDINEGNFAAVRAGLAPTWEGIAKLTDEQFAARMTSAGKNGVAIDPNAFSAEINGIQDPDERARVQRLLSGQIAQQEAQYKQYSDTIGLDILTHKVTSESEILDDPVLSIGDKETHLRAFRTEQDNAGGVADAMVSFSNGSLTVDPYDAKGKKTVDNLFNELATTVPTDRIMPATEEIVRQTGVVPQQVMSGLRQGLESGNVATVLRAAQQAARFSQINPAALGRREGGAGVQTIADDFNHYVNDLNLTPQQAAQRVADSQNPEKQRERKVLEPAAKEFRKSVEKTDIGSLFDESVLPFNDPQVGFTAGQALGIQADFVQIAEEQFFQANGDPDLAINRAKQEMQRLYGVTEMSGGKVIMKHPPERYWPAARPSNFTEAFTSSPYDWVTDQLKTDILAIDPNFPRAQTVVPDASGLPTTTEGGPDMTRLHFVATPETDAMVKRGEIPAYQIMYEDADGVLQTVPKLWRPDPSVIYDKNADVQKKQVESAREEQVDERKRAILSNEDDGGRGASLDAFLDGPDALAIDKVGD